MALRLKDCAKAISFVNVATVHALGAIWLQKNNRTPNYPSLGLLHGYKLGDYGSLNPCKVPTCGAMTNVRQATSLFGSRYGYKLGDVDSL